MDLSTDFCHIVVATTDDGVKIQVHGDVDLASAPLLDAAFAALDGHGVAEVDLSEMTFCDAAGLSSLERAHARLGVRMRVAGASPMLRRLATVLGIDWLGADMDEPPERVHDAAS